MEGNNAFHDGFFSVQTAAAQLHAKMGQALTMLKFYKISNRVSIFTDTASLFCYREKAFSPNSLYPREDKN